MKKLLTLIIYNNQETQVINMTCTKLIILIDEKHVFQKISSWEWFL